MHFSVISSWSLKTSKGSACTHIGRRVDPSTIDEIDRSSHHMASVTTDDTESHAKVRACRVHLPDRSGQTGALRFRYTGLVWPVIGRNRSNSNLNSNSNFSVQSVRTGIPLGLIGIPAGLAGNRSNSIFFSFLV